MDEETKLLKAELKMFSNCSFADFVNLLNRAEDVLKKQTKSNKEVIGYETRLQNK